MLLPCTIPLITALSLLVEAGCKLLVLAIEDCLVAMDVALVIPEAASSEMAVPTDTDSAVALAAGCGTVLRCDKGLEMLITLGDCAEER